MKSKREFIVILLLIINLVFTGSVGFYVWKSTHSQNSNEKMQYKMYVGTNDKDTFEQIISTDNAKIIIEDICFKYLEGYTIQDARGAWVDENGNVSRENTIVCYFDDIDNDTVYKIADEILKSLNQNTVLIEKDLKQIEFYGGTMD